MFSGNLRALAKQLDSARWVKSAEMFILARAARQALWRAADALDKVERVRELENTAMLKQVAKLEAEIEKLRSQLEIAERINSK